jgi:hypothetical protein
MLSTIPKKKPCRHCGTEFMPARPLAVVCSPLCASRMVKVQKAQEKAQTKARKERIKTIPMLLKEAQHAFNAWTRERDRIAGHACISSGRPLDWSGNGVDAGHYRSVGAASHLRFNEDNCHAQSKKDNQWLSGNAVDYRLGLIARIGLERVEALEASNDSHKWTADELRQIKRTYVDKLKQLKKENA